MNGQSNSSMDHTVLTPAEVVHRDRCFELCRQSIEAVQTIKNSVPPQDDYDYYSAFPRYQNVITKLNKQIFQTMNNILTSEKFVSTFHNDKFTSFEDKFDLMVEANDSILEKAGQLLDEKSGFGSSSSSSIKTTVLNRSLSENSAASWNRSSASGKPAKDFTRFTCLNWLAKPQEVFEKKPDNSTLPFISDLPEKPNCVKVLSDVYTGFLNGKYREKMSLVNELPILERQLPFTQYMVDQIIAHQYEAELQTLHIPDEFLKQVECRKPKEMTKENLKFVDNVDLLEEMIEDLQKQKEIAVDLEHHSHRTFLGIVCLMQLSTRDFDYVVDTLALRSHVNKLNKVFTDPKILKVLHGCDSDVVWLQRDFSVYLVNVFDTGQAARALSYPTFALSYLLKKFIDYDSSKHYQLADWRQRPLPDEMIEYARMDTHPLLYIADNLRNELLSADKDALFEVFNKSRQICLRKYVKPEYTQDSYLKLLKTIRKRLSKQSEFVISKLYQWREETARLLDESLVYVLPNHMLIRIAETLPREAQGILACCNPVPPLVREYLSVLHKIVLEGKSKVFEENQPKILYQSVSQPDSVASSLPHDSGALENDVKIDALTQKCQVLAVSEPQFNIFQSNQPRMRDPEKIHNIMSQFQHPIAMYLPNMESEMKFLSAKERDSDTLTLKMSQRGEMPKISHRWRLLSHADIIAKHEESMKEKMDQPPASNLETDLDKEPAPIPIVFDEDKISPVNIESYQSKKELKKDKKRKKRDVSESGDGEVEAKKKKKSISSTSIATCQASEVLAGNKKASEHIEVAEDEEHPTLAPSKPKKSKSLVKLPKIKGLSNKTFSFKH